MYTSHKVVWGMNRIRDLRLQRSMNQAELAALLNCTTATVSKYELEQRSIDAPTILRLCEIFGCSADYLLGRSPLLSPELTPEEEELLLSWRRATPEIRAIIDAALAPYREEAAPGIASAPTA